MDKQPPTKGVELECNKTEVKKDPSMPVPSGNQEATLSAMPAELLLMILKEALPRERHLFHLDHHNAAYLVNSTLHAVAMKYHPPKTRFFVHIDTNPTGDSYRAFCAFILNSKRASAISSVTSLRVVTHDGTALWKDKSQMLKYIMLALLKKAGFIEAAIHWEASESAYDMEYNQAFDLKKIIKTGEAR